jgi:hypothetical protein
MPQAQPGVVILDVTLDDLEIVTLERTTSWENSIV